MNANLLERAVFCYTIGMVSLHLLRVLAACMALLPVRALALQQSTITVPGLRITFSQLMRNIVGFLASTAVLVCTALFLIGAYLMVFRAYDSNKLDEGKAIMKGALIGLAVILGSYGILRTVLSVLYY